MRARLPSLSLFLSLFSPRPPLALIACTYIRTYVNTHVCTFRKFIQLHPNSFCSYKQDIMTSTMTFIKIANKFLILTLSKCYKVTNDIFVQEVLPWIIYVKKIDINENIRKYIR